MANRQPSLALFTDLYELTMAQAYWQSGETAQATFSLYIRNYPPDRGYFVLGGVQDALDYLKDLRFSDDETRYLRSLDLFGPRGQEPQFPEPLRQDRGQLSDLMKFAERNKLDQIHFDAVYLITDE